jgi:hypothetical protein
MLGRESAIEGASADASGGRMPLVDMDGSNVAMMKILGEEGVVTLMCPKTKFIGGDNRRNHGSVAA